MARSTGKIHKSVSSSRFRSAFDRSRAARRAASGQLLADGGDPERARALVSDIFVAHCERGIEGAASRPITIRHCRLDSVALCAAQALDTSLLWSYPRVCSAAMRDGAISSACRKSVRHPEDFAKTPDWRDFK